MAASMENAFVADILENFSKLTSKPEVFTSVQRKQSETYKKNSKCLYDTAQSVKLKQTNSKSTELTELITDSMDEEQIWQQLELCNETTIQTSLERLAHMLVGKSIEFDIEDDLEVDDIENDDDNDMDNFMDEDNASSDSDDESGVDFDSDEGNTNIAAIDASKQATKNKQTPKSIVKSRTKKSVVDDKFFNLADMERFLEQQDRLYEKEHNDKPFKDNEEDSSDDDDEDEDEDDDDIDLGDDDAEADYMYADFFDPPTTEEGLTGSKKSVSFNAEDDEQEFNDEDLEDVDDDDLSAQKVQGQGRDLFQGSDSEGEDTEDILGGKKSSFEQRKEKMTKKIAEMETMALEAKPWQLSGEAAATIRSENSLLEEDLMFDHTSRLPKEITEEVTQELEDLIKQRIKDQAFDDVERKEKKTEEVFEYKKRIVLDQEKSKASLAEVYEQEYLKQTQGEKEEEEDKDHAAIKKSMQSLFIKLDALSNFHYTPKLASTEVKVVSNMPSISMEEVAPVSVSDAALLAPQEIQEKTKKELKGKTEKSETDRKSERREKKKQKKIRIKEKEARIKAKEKRNPGVTTQSKKQALEKLKKQTKSGNSVTIIKDSDHKKSSLTSSKAFFTELQEGIKAKGNKIPKTKNNKHKNATASKLKL
ncbi:unnamed protein product [Owenia fusiformis]|uniref:U3 small nucleolar ribonucleoprotein protein MPP10 n=1 Tax=Owenia fusiformis TaxID=6347 RepID=A0A8J1XRC4_OWEFU|nr:unnamed protein product [Owenia fusiformis]